MLVFFALLQAAVPRPYWQQQLSYTIDASLDEEAGTLAGTQRVGYHNRAPDTLTTISFHLYLNAFRPGSRWADADSVERRRRFNDLADPDFARNAVSNVRIMGQLAAPSYPFAPDSTIVRFALPAPLLPGDSMVVEMDWLARPSTVPRRQGRRGRAFDFAQWYPRVVAYDRRGWQEQPLHPAGEFYGDFGEFTVALDVPEDQVIGATGVPLCGDPGWERANQAPGRPIEYQRNHYPEAASRLTSDACAPRGPGRKTVVWRAEEVHHFALSMRPDYRYEGGRWGTTAVHVLYQPGDEASWGGGVAARRTETALEWLDGLFGAYPWPQITNVHRIEGGGTEFPMMVHDGDASLGLILHEVGHNYLMGILANNEWKEGFLDEGFTSFQSTWYFEDKGFGSSYRSDEMDILRMDLDGWSEPTSLPSHQYRDFVTYGSMIYTRGELFFHQLREIVGSDVMRRILRTYYQRYRLKHVDEAAFRSVAEEISGRDLTTFFAQWLHSTVLYDYSVGRVKVRQAADGRWVTRVEVRRDAPGVFPVEVMVRSKRDTARVRAEGGAEREWVEAVTRDKPREVMIDPGARSHDWDLLDNRKTRGLLGWARNGRRDLHIDRVFSTRVHRDRWSDAWLPTAWYNDAGGLMVGLRRRTNYLGRFDQRVDEWSVATRRCCGDGDQIRHFHFRLRNPRALYSPRLETSFEAYRVEGRQGVAAAVAKERKGHLGYGPRTVLGGSIRWLATYDRTYLDPALYENAGTVEGAVTIRSTEQRGRWAVIGSGSVGGGVEYKNRGTGLATDDRYDAQPYLRVEAEVIAKRTLGRRGRLGVRVFGGAVDGADGDPVRQRWFYLAGADPYQQLPNPFLRSRDALLTGDVHYHLPGGANARGFARDVAATAVASVNIEVDRSVRARPRATLFRDVRVAGFVDGALSDGFFSIAGATRWAGDFGVGVRFEHRIGETTFTTRFDFPVLVSHADRAVGGAAGDGRGRFRWVVGLGPGF
ncbi:MAG: M1 family metallopeptidase [Gemmatimonadales bacterium]